MIDGRTRDILRRLLARRDPSAEVLLDVERLGPAGVDAISELLQEGNLSERKQARALQGLGYAVKHASAEEHRIVLERALERVGAKEIGLRSKAAHMAVMTLVVLENWAPSMALELGAIRARVATGVREALRLGLHEYSEAVVRRFLTREGSST